MRSQDSINNQLRSALMKALEDEIIDRDSLAQLIIGMSRDRQAILVWPLDEWEDYWEHEEDNACARLSNADMLDAIDAATLDLTGEEASFHGNEVRFAEASVAAQVADLESFRRTQLKEALRNLANDQALGTFPSLVGLMYQDKAEAYYAKLVAFYHPQGTQEILPLREGRAGSISIYQFGVLTDEGLTMFYPEGQGDGLDSDKQAASSKVYAFADMEMWREDDDEIVFRMKGDLADITMEPGHTQEEHGGLSSEEVQALLLRHFRTHPELVFDPARIPNPTNEAAFDAWLARYLQLGATNGYHIVENAVEDFGLAAARAFVERQPEDSEDRGATLAKWARVLYDVGELDEALQVMRCGLERPRSANARIELQALLTLHRHDEALQRADELCRKDYDEYAPYKALALANLGNMHEARGAMDNMEDRGDGLDLWVEARLAWSEAPDRAQALLRSAYSHSQVPTKFAERDLKDCPGLMEVARDHERLVATQARCDQTVVSALSQDCPTPLLFDLPPARRLCREVDEQRLDAKIRKVRQIGETTWVNMDNRGIGMLEPGANGVTIRMRYETPCVDFAVCGRWLFMANDEQGLVVADLKAGEIAETVATCPLPFSSGASSIAVGDGVVAIVANPGAALFDVTDPTQPVQASIVGCAYGDLSSSYGEDVVIDGSTLFMAAGRTALVIADISDIRNPVVLSALCRGDGTGEIDDNLYFRNAIVQDGLALLLAGSATWLIDVDDPLSPKSLWLWSHEDHRIGAWTDVGISEGGRRYFVHDDSDAHMFFVDISRTSPPRVHETFDVVRQDGGHHRFHSIDGMRQLADERWLLMHGNKIQTAAFDEQTNTPDTSAAVEACEDALYDQLIEILNHYAEHHEERKIGVVMASYAWERAELLLDVPRSIAGIHCGPVAALAPEADGKLVVYSNQITDEDGAPPAFSPSALLSSDSDDESDPAWQRVIAKVLRRVADSTELANISAGRVYLVHRHYDRGDDWRYDVLAVHKEESQDWKPWRRSGFGTIVKPLADRLNFWRGKERLHSELQANDELWKELLQLVSQGHSGAMEAAFELRERDEEGVLSCFLGLCDGRETDTQLVEYLAGYISRDEVRSSLEDVYDGIPDDSDGTDDDLLLAVASALGKGDDDKVVAVAQRRWHPEDEDDFDDNNALAALQCLGERVVEFQKPLLDWVQRAGQWDHQLGDMAKELFRSGWRELPKNLAVLSKSEKQSEEYASMILGIKVLDEDRGDDSVCQAERLFTSWKISQHVSNLLDSDDLETSVWPEDLAHEPWPASWKYTLARVLPRLRETDQLEGFWTLLLAHAGADEKYEADHWLLRSALEITNGEEDFDTAIRLAHGIRGGEGFDDRAKSRAKAYLIQSLINGGWPLVHEGNFPEAHRRLDELLELGPHEGVVHMYAARLAWIEHADPLAGVQVAEKAIKLLDRDAQGRGRLLNLIGCAHDEVGDAETALPYFEKAWQAHTTDPTYLANIAECHEKLGNQADALKWAKEALARKAKSELCERIVAEAGED